MDTNHPKKSLEHKGSSISSTVVKGAKDLPVGSLRREATEMMLRMRAKMEAVELQKKKEPEERADKSS